MPPPLNKGIPVFSVEGRVQFGGLGGGVVWLYMILKGMSGMSLYEFQWGPYDLERDELI